jgi:hypothetical protein
MDALQFDSLPLALVLWLIVYVADYYLTIYGRRLWLKNAKDYLVFAGSYELNPYYQKDIDADRLLSRRFIFSLSFGIVWLVLMWLSTRYLKIPQVFPAAVGFLILQEVVIISTHIQNVRLFTLAAADGAVQGQITYARWVGMDGTAWKFAYWGIVFLVLALVMGNWFFIGGTVSGLNNFIRFRRRGLRMRQLPKPVSS